MGLMCFLEAEDGIRDGHVTGVQTCALPISPAPRRRTTGSRQPGRHRAPPTWQLAPSPRYRPRCSRSCRRTRRGEIGRASCRERVYSFEVYVRLRAKEAASDVDNIMDYEEAD